MLSITCPYCREQFKPYHDPSCYEWSYMDGDKAWATTDYRCPSCQSEITYELEAHFANVTITESHESAQYERESYESYCESKLDAEREEM